MSGDRQCRQSTQTHPCLHNGAWCSLQVQYEPYDLKDYDAKSFNPKKAPGYWTLGSLGPNTKDSELQAKVGWAQGSCRVLRAASLPPS